LKVVVASPLEAGSQWAHALNTIKMADGFSKIGHDVTLITRRENGCETKSKQELVDMYGIDDRLHWLQLKTEYMGINVYRQGFPFSWKACQLARSIRPGLVYGRDFYFPWLCARAGVNAAAESHAPPGTDSFRLKTLVRATHNPHFKIWATISETLREYYCSMGADGSKIKVLPDAVDLSMFSRPADSGDSPYEKGKSNVVYAGHLYDYKGIPTILGSAKRLPHIAFHLIGGWPGDIARHQRSVHDQKLRNVTFHGLRKHAEVPRYLWHADVLLLPPSGTHPSAAWTSPVKLGEYLASGAPVIASDIPALRTWLSDEESLFIAPDDPEAMAEGICSLIHDSALAKSVSSHGMKRAQSLSYESRATAICKALEQ
jgi:glycosyltransferase involved in cell wall biosynthesis